jgi:hypothetical protein
MWQGLQLDANATGQGGCLLNPIHGRVVGRIEQSRGNDRRQIGAEQGESEDNGEQEMLKQHDAPIIVSVLFAREHPAHHRQTGNRTRHDT